MSEKKPCVALVGISGYGRVYLRAVEAAASRREIQFAAAVVINPEEELESCERLRAAGVGIYASWRQMLQEWNGRLDLCLIPAPIHLHADITVCALLAGAHVLVEKPLAPTVEQFQLIQQIEQDTGRWVAVGYQNFYAATTQAIRRDLAAGRLGVLREIRWLGLWPRSDAYYTRNDWAGRMRIGNQMVRDSPLNNAMAHFVNLSLYWAGKDPGRAAFPQLVEAELFRCFPIESFDTAVVRVKTDTNVRVHMAVTHCCPEEHPVQIQIIGEKGELTWTHRRQALWQRKGETIEPWNLDPEEKTVAAMFAAVFKRLRDPRSPVCTTAAAYPQVELIEKIHACAPIRQASFVRKPGPGLTSRPIVGPGIGSDLEECLRAGALPSELGMDWAGEHLDHQAEGRPLPLASHQAEVL